MILTPEIFMRSYCVATDAIYDPTYTYGRNYCMYVTCLLKDTCARRFKTWIGYIENVMIISNVTYRSENAERFQVQRRSVFDLSTQQTYSTWPPLQRRPTTFSRRRRHSPTLRSNDACDILLPLSNNNPSALFSSSTETKLLQ